MNEEAIWKADQDLHTKMFTGTLRAEIKNIGNKCLKNRALVGLMMNTYHSIKYAAKDLHLLKYNDILKMELIQYNQTK